METVAGTGIRIYLGRETVGPSSELIDVVKAHKGILGPEVSENGYERIAHGVDR